MLHLEIFISMGNFESNLIFAILVSFQSVSHVPGFQPIYLQPYAQRYTLHDRLILVQNLRRINATHPHLNMAPKAPNLTEHFSIENMVTNENVLILPYSEPLCRT